MMAELRILIGEGDWEWEQRVEGSGDLWQMTTEVLMAGVVMLSEKMRPYSHTYTYRCEPFHMTLQNSITYILKTDII